MGPPKSSKFHLTRILFDFSFFVQHAQVISAHVGMPRHQTRFPSCAGKSVLLYLNATCVYNCFRK